MAGGILLILLALAAVALFGLPSRLASLVPLSSDRSDWSFLYVIGGNLWETDGRQVIQLTRAGHFGQPALDAPSSTRSGLPSLVYVEIEKNSSDLWLVDSRHPPRLITHDSSPVVDQNHWTAQPVFLPGSQQLLVLGDHNKESTGTGDLAVWQLDLQTGAFSQITHPPAYTGGDQDVTINPRNPRQIVFTRYVYADNGQLTEQLVWLDRGANTAIPLTAADHTSRQADFSPDGSQLAFVQAVGQNENLFVGQLDLTGGKPRLVDVQPAATGVIAEPVWRPDGKAIAYLALGNRQFQLFTLSAERATNGRDTFGKPRPVTTGPRLDATSRPVWLTSVEARSLPDWLNRPPLH